MNNEKFIPENDVQEMYELQGRVYAAEVYIRNVTFPERDVLLSMLGAEPDKVTILKQKLEEKEKELDEALARIVELEADFDEGILVEPDLEDLLNEEMDLEGFFDPDPEPDCDSEEAVSDEE